MCVACVRVRMCVYAQVRARAHVRARVRARVNIPLRSCLACQRVYVCV